jgi:hypothetical protein
MPLPQREYTERDVELARKVYRHLLQGAQVTRHGRFLTYKDVGNAVGEHYRTLAGALYCIQDHCRERDWPTLTVWVVRKDSGLPGMGCDVVEPSDVTRIAEATKQVAWPDEPWW